VAKIQLFAPVATPLVALAELELTGDFIYEGVAPEAFRISALAPRIGALDVLGRLHPETALEGNTTLWQLDLNAAACRSLGVLASCKALDKLRIVGRDGFELLRTLSPGSGVRELTLSGCRAGEDDLRRLTPTLLPALHSLRLLRFSGGGDDANLIALAAFPRLVSVHITCGEYHASKDALALLSLLPRIEDIVYDADWIDREFASHCERMAPSGRLRISLGNY